MSFLIILSLLGAMAMRVVQTDIDVAGAERTSEHALYVAEAGLEWARQELTDEYWDAGNNRVDTVALWADLGTVVASGPLAGWQPLGAAQAFGGGQYTPYIKDDDVTDKRLVTDPDGNFIILLRVLGESQGARRLLEVAVIPP